MAGKGGPYRRNMKAKVGLNIKNMNRVQPMPVRTVHRAPRGSEEFTRETTNANIHQAVTSSTAAADRANICDWHRIVNQN